MLTAEDQWVDHWLFTDHALATDDLTHGLRRLPLDEALTKTYLRTNIASLTNMLVVDVDDPDADRLVKTLSWDDQTLPEPNWMTVNPSTGHAHVGYWLTEPVTTTEVARMAPLRFCSLVHEGLRATVPGDPAYTNRITRNPLHPGHQTTYMATEPYLLADLAARITDMPRRLPKKARRVGLGRNCTLFDDVRTWAYSQFKNFTRFDQFHKAVQMYAETVAIQFVTDPLPASEVRAIARSVAKWTWSTFDTAEFSRRQAARAAKRRKIPADMVL